MKSLKAILIFAAVAAVARGQEPAGRPSEGPPMTLGISPLRAELKIAAGVQTSQAVRLSNSGKVPTQIRVTVADWTLTPSGEQQFTKLGAGTWGCGSWLTVNPINFALAPGAVELVRYTMNVPSTAPEGGYHCAIIFDTLPPPRDQLAEGTGVVNLVRLVTTLYPTVGNPPIVAKIKRLEMNPRREGKKVTYDIVTAFGNEGTTQYRVSGDLRLLDASGRTVKTFEYKSFPVLPGVDRESVFTLEESLPAGEYLLRAVVDVGGKERLAAETHVTVVG